MESGSSLFEQGSFDLPERYVTGTGRLEFSGRGPIAKIDGNDSPERSMLCHVVQGKSLVPVG
jgi:hypothetical protein